MTRERAPRGAAARKATAKRGITGSPAPRGAAARKATAKRGIERVAGYRLERRLDAGGEHEVWLARANDGKAVALKLGGAPQPADPDEELIPGLVPVLESGMSDGLPYQVMPLVPGATLAERLADGPLAPDEADRLVASLARILDALHAVGRTHGDVRPANIVLGPEGAVMLLDREVRESTTPRADREALRVLARAL